MTPLRFALLLSLALATAGCAAGREFPPSQFEKIDAPPPPPPTPVVPEKAYWV